MNKLYDRINSEKQVYVTNNEVNPEWIKIPSDEWGVISGSVRLPASPLMEIGTRVKQRKDVPEVYGAIKESLPKQRASEKALVSEMYFIPTETPSEAGRLARDINRSRKNL